LPGWQHFASKTDEANSQIVGIALEHNGAERARPFVEQAGATFPVLVDEKGQSSARFGFKAVPNGVLVDTDGMIRWAKYGGFSVDNAEDLETVRRFFVGEQIEPYEMPDAPYELTAARSREVERLVRRGHELLSDGRNDDAVQAWQQALKLDPENLVIRKQIWAARYPERFHPVIDWDWQKRQLAEERADEVARGICGPDGCPLPPLA
jgi:tetratricopeptide (TPR) repeat protein